ncbi:type IV pilus assembly protein PilM [Cellulomonas marina]|uniref:Type IV pilus assembly protein PilM n=1 Tax=Cellulomonas marina TaxID=988821 RepID=A0A1I0W7Q8_9CELL|nr:type IV pilus assembly protein PilM [Cellulomonas marina]GIG29128.1 fimbrial assembly protein [Cellulomonas marina]SFA84621.1 type IV pilus assembly protein PilM [Cellulomonas marina]
MASRHVIGLDIGTTAVRAAEVAPAGSSRRPRPTLVRYGEHRLPAGAVREGEVVDALVVSQALRELWSRTGFSHKDVVIGVGNQRVVVRELDLPWLPLAQLKASLPLQVQELLPVGAADAILDFHPTDETEGETGRTVHGMLVAAQRDTVSANLRAVEDAGLRPTMVDLNAFALLRALARGEHAERTVALVDVGARLTNVVVATGGRPRLVRVIPSGGQHVTDAVAAALEVPPAEAEVAKRRLGTGAGAVPGAVPPELAAAAEAVDRTCRALVESVRNTLVYYAGQHTGARVELVVLTGGGVHLAGLGQLLSSTTRLPAVLGDALAGYDLGRAVDRTALDGAGSLVALPVGLASGVAA